MPALLQTLKETWQRRDRPERAQDFVRGQLTRDERQLLTLIARRMDLLDRTPPRPLEGARDTPGARRRRLM